MPRRTLGSAAVGAVRTVRSDQIGGSPERLVGDPHHLLGSRHVLRGERVAVCLVLVGEVGARVADVRLQHEQARSVGDGHRRPDRRLERVAVVGDVAEFGDVPPVRAEALHDVVTAGERRGTVDGDAVVVEDAHQAAEPLVSGERCGLVADALHQAAVAGDHEGVVLHQIGAEAGTQVPLRHGHSDRVGEALSEGAGGDLHAGGVARLGVAGGRRTPLAERLQVVEFESVAAEEEQCVLQDRRVTGREDEAVAVDPLRFGGVVPHDARVEDVGEWSKRHRRALVPALRVQRCIHRESAHECDGLLFLFGGEGSGHGATVPEAPRATRLPRQAAGA